MERTEIQMIVAEEALEKARKAHDAAVRALLLAKKKGEYTEEHHREEVKAREALMAAENRLKKTQEAKEKEEAISDEEAEKLGDWFAGNPSGWEAETDEEISEEDEAMVDAIVAGLD